MVKLQPWFLAQKFKYSYLQENVARHVLKSSKLYKLDFSPIWKDLKLKIPNLQSSRKRNGEIFKKSREKQASHAFNYRWQERNFLSFPGSIASKQNSLAILTPFLDNAGLKIAVIVEYNFLYNNRNFGIFVDFSAVLY